MLLSHETEETAEDLLQLDIGPEQPASVQRQQVELYADFLKTPVKLWVDAKIGMS